MRVLLTHAGRHGDALWSLATVRAVAETIGEPVDFCLSAKYGGLAPLIQEQDYIRQCWVDPQWDVRETAPISPAEPPSGEEREGRMLSREVSPLEPPLGKILSYDRVIHLSFRGWPKSKTLAEGYWENVKEEQASWLGEFGGLRELEVERAWIRAEPGGGRNAIAIGFSDEWFELKLGITTILDDEFRLIVLCAEGSRWHREGAWSYQGWEEMAQIIDAAQLFVGCLSAPWVLANALGKRCVIVEPAEARHHPVFWLDSPRNTLVHGSDGKPTFDARHVVDEVRKALEEGAKR